MTDTAQMRADLTDHQGSGALYPVRGVPPTVQAELLSQLETALAFADYCVFLGAGAGIDRAAQLVHAAQELYEETMDALRRHGAPE